MNVNQLNQLQEMLATVQTEHNAVQDAQRRREKAVEAFYNSSAYQDLTTAALARDPQARTVLDIIAALGRGNYAHAQAMLRQLAEEQPAAAGNGQVH